MMKTIIFTLVLFSSILSVNAETITGVKIIKNMDNIIKKLKNENLTGKQESKGEPCSLISNRMAGSNNMNLAIVDENQKELVSLLIFSKTRAVVHESPKYKGVNIVTYDINQPTEKRSSKNVASLTLWIVDNSTKIGVGLTNGNKNILCLFE